MPYIFRHVKPLMHSNLYYSSKNTVKCLNISTVRKNGG